MGESGSAACIKSLYKSLYKLRRALSPPQNASLFVYYKRLIYRPLVYTCRHTQGTFNGCEVGSLVCIREIHTTKAALSPNHEMRPPMCYLKRNQFSPATQFGVYLAMKTIEQVYLVVVQMFGHAFTSIILEQRIDQKFNDPMSICV